MGKNKQPDPATFAQQEAMNRYQQSANQQNQSQNEFNEYQRMLQSNSQRANNNAFNDYSQMMGNYSNFYGSLSPTQFSYQTVAAKRPDELNEAYGYLREAMPGYRDFAQTGGYNKQDIQELRARGVEPIRAQYASAMRDIDRAKALGGGYAPNYIAARSRAQRQMPGQIADALTGVNANLAQQIRQGRMFGLQGITGTGSEMGGMAGQEAGRMLQADLANQEADLRSQGMTEESLQNMYRNQLAAMAGQSSLYGTTPGMANMFGNQAMESWNTRLGNENNQTRQQQDWLNLMMQANQVKKSGTPWWKTALTVAATVAPYVAMMSDKNVKRNIKPVQTGKVSKALKSLPIYTWEYKDDKTRTKHLGPIAQEFKRKFGIGDGKTIHAVDAVGVLLASQKEMLEGRA